MPNHIFSKLNLQENTLIKLGFQRDECEACVEGALPTPDVPN